MSEEQEKVISQELACLREKCSQIEGAEVVTCVRAHVRIELRKTPHKAVSICLHFAPGYPDEPLCVELKSKVFSDKVLEGLLKLSEAETKKNCGRPQIFSLVKFLNTFIIENPMVVCNDEINEVKRVLLAPQDELKVKQKTSQVGVKCRHRDYFANFRLTVPDGYPAEMMVVELGGSNFPDLLRANFLGQAKEIARMSVEPPLKKNPKKPPFEPSPSLFRVCNFLIRQCIKTYPEATCSICGKQALPDDPKVNKTDNTDPNFVDRVYCGHLFHHGCLDKYLKTPPFQGGKKCPTCGKQIYHKGYNCNPAIQEARWAHQEARARELDEVIDFMQ